ncbi:MAG: type IV-A pilus assembly ATPase PilB [Proteobacteria bacterium]|nr:type IV-A pilus assembly ATPase PilB [Pseudomonadota bacterium]
MEKIGELLLKERVITPDQLKKAIEEQKIHGGRLGSTMVNLGFIKEYELVNFLSKQYGVPAVNLREFEIDPKIAKVVPYEVCEKYTLIPINRAGSTLIVAIADPSNIFAIDDVKFLTGYNVEVVVSSEAAIKEAIEREFKKSSAKEQETQPEAGSELEDISLEDTIQLIEDVEDIEVVQEEEDVNISELQKATEDAPVVKLVNAILNEAIKRRASDIHVEPYEKTFRVRFRIDGVLQEIMTPPLKLKNAIVSRLKILSSLDIAERRLPQDGRIKLKLGRGREMDFRVNTLPTLFGEKVCLRLLDKSNLQLDMTKLGFSEEQLKLFKDAIHRPYGMVLVTGPTGSGKTTTLYSALAELNKITENISTAEDPVEYNLAGINQVQMNEAIGLNFANVLRAFLRQDPDIIMVGEIRDFETAEIAIKAALTGHLVLSTLHTNDAPSTIARLLNMGVEPFLVASATNLVLAQRLARKICQECKEPINVPVKALVDIGIPPEEAKEIVCYKGKGCNTCGNTGFKGRIALYEVMMLYDELKELILAGAPASELKRAAMRLGMVTLRQSGIEKLKAGITTIEEVVRCSVKD